MSSKGKKRGVISRKRLVIAACSIAALALVPAVAIAHIERASYWPDPAPDTSVSPPAGGAVPDARSLYTALDQAQPGDTRVVCQGQAVPYRADQDVSHARVDKLKAKLRKARKANKEEKARRLKRRLRRAKRNYRQALAAEMSARQAYQQQLGQQGSMQALDAATADARANGYKIRLSQPAIHPSDAELSQLRDFNAQLLAQCHYGSIQAAVNDSGNNDRVVVMPGLYTEPASRAAPTNDPACDQYEEQNDKGDTGAVSYRYQVHCPNDQNLIAVMGRAENGDAPQPPRDDRHGIPDLGPCIRCNFQIEGSGVGPDDVVVDAGNTASGNGAPIGPVKDVGIRADRADGFVLQNMTVRHAAEHGIYIMESDGYRIQRFKTPFSGEYGVLTFVEDHGLMQDCDSWGNGDSDLYPGASAELGEQRDQVAEPTARYGQELRRCDMHHSPLGYSGTDGNAVHVHDNEFYDNATGLSSDVFTAPGHPGFPSDSALIENNNFHDNNFNPFIQDSNGDLIICDSANGENPGPHGQDTQGCTDVVPTVPVPVGVGLWFPGANNMTVRNNRFWDNWRRGTMLFTVADQFVCNDPGIQLSGCNPTAVPPSTSYRNKTYGNVMGVDPNGNVDPNGTDFWWDQGGATPHPDTHNCWHDNTGTDGTAASITTLPPGPSDVPPGPGLPSDCDTPNASPATGGNVYGQNAELLNCLGDIEFNTDTCDWYLTPDEPQP